MDDTSVRDGASAHDLHVWAAVLVALVPVVVSVVRAAFDHYVPGGDLALIEMQVRAVGSRATPLVGAWSRFGWQHPGPIMFYALALPYRLAGTAPFGLQLGAAIIDGAAVAGCVLLVARRGRAAPWLIALALAALQLGFGANLLRDEWNASLVLLPFALLLVAAAEAYEGSRAALAIVPLAATFVAQTHVAYVALSLPAIVLWGAALRHRWRDRPARHTAYWATALAALCWLPVALDALAHSGGNARKIIDYSLRSHGATSGFGAAAKLVGTATSLSPRAINGLKESIFFVLEPKATAVLPGITLIGLAVVVLWRTATPSVRRLAGLLLATWAVGFVAAARVSGPLYPHLVWWLVPLTVLSWWCIVMTIIARAERRAAERPAGERPAGERESHTVSRLSSIIVGIAAATVAVLAIVLSVRVADSQPTLAARKPAIVAASAGILRARAAAPTANGRVVVDRTGDYLSDGAVQAGVLAHLAHHGITALVPASEPSRGPGNTEGNRSIFGSRRLAAPGQPPSFLLAQRVSELHPPGRLLATSDPLTPAEQARWRRDYDTVAAALDQVHHPELVAWLPTPYSFIARQQAPAAFASSATTTAFDDLQALNGRGEAVVLWALPKRK